METLLCFPESLISKDGLKVLIRPQETIYQTNIRKTICMKITKLVWLKLRNKIINFLNLPIKHKP